MDPEREKQNRLNRVESKLYSRKFPSVIDPGRSTLGSTEAVNINNSWAAEENNRFDTIASKFSRVAENKQSFVKKIFFASLIFFLLAAGIATFVFLGGVNQVSSKNVDIKILGPLTVGGGQESSFDISIVNANNTDLESASLTVEFPEGTRDPTDLSQELKREIFPLGVIKNGESYNQKISGVFFGEKESVKEIKISLEYRVKNSSATFYKEKNYEISISSSPIIITPTYPKEINSNQDITFSIEVFSNSKESINDLLVQVEYPFGFVYKSSSLLPLTGGNNIWKFSELSSGSKKTINIVGSIIGQDNEEKVFRINSGTASKDDERTIGVPIVAMSESILVKKPFIDLVLLIDNKEGDYAAKGGSPVFNQIVLRNNLPEKLFNLSVEASLSGGALNQSSVVVGEGGFFRSLDNVILWDNRSISSLGNMDPGTEQKLSFRLTPLAYSQIQKGSNPLINILVKIKGERVLDSGSVESISAMENAKIVLATDLELSSKSVRSIGNIENSGPIPPKVNIPTSYTIVWSLKNSFNQVSSTQVKATLPSYVKWKDIINPIGENVTYNQSSNEVVWNAGTVLPNTGFGSSPKEVYFQVELTPSVSQLNTTPILVGSASLSAIDKITGLKIENILPPVTTTFSSDPTFKQDNDRVVQ